MNNKIVSIIIECLKDLNEEIGSDQLDNPTADTVIYGTSGALDSLALVRFLVDVEGKVSDEFDTMISIMDERAVSQKRSPFRSVKRLTAYIEDQLGGEPDER